ncbi:MAG TPA: AraC family transcriptional regulator [Spirochaetales bacterium]|nr:AraC family transcriptional regulator [Spirochaetales bacterium]
MEIRDIVYEYRISEGERIAWHSRYHAHGEREFEVHYFLEGAGSFLNHRAKYSIRPESLFLTGPHEFHSIIPDPQNIRKEPISYYAVLFAVEPAEEELLQILNPELKGLRNPITLNTRYHFIFETLLQLWRGPLKHQRKAAEYQLLSFLYSVYGTEDRTEPISQKGWVHVQKALEVMRRDTKNKLTIDTIARKVGISKEYLIRLFQMHLHISPLQYATRMRIEAASGYLISTNKTIGEIAFLFGFENQFHFSRVFKKCTGLCPSTYRKYYLQYVDIFPPQPLFTGK